MYGALVGDIVGSRFEFHNHRSKEFELFTEQSTPTDDSFMTLAIGAAVMECDGASEKLGEAAVRWMRDIGNLYPDAGFGGKFALWLRASDPKPYHSFGNGSAQLPIITPVLDMWDKFICRKTR